MILQGWGHEGVLVVTSSSLFEMNDCVYASGEVR